MATLPVEPTVTPLRQRMLDDMTMRAMRSRTQHDYVRHVRAFAAFLRRSPDTATAEDVRRFQMHQRQRLLYRLALGQPNQEDLINHLARGSDEKIAALSAQRSALSALALDVRPVGSGGPTVHGFGAGRPSPYKR